MGAVWLRCLSRAPLRELLLQPHSASAGLIILPGNRAARGAAFRWEELCRSRCGMAMLSAAPRAARADPAPRAAPALRFPRVPRPGVTAVCGRCMLTYLRCGPAPSEPRYLMEVDCVC